MTYHFFFTAHRTPNRHLYVGTTYDWWREEFGRLEGGEADLVGGAGGDAMKKHSNEEQGAASGDNMMAAAEESTS